MCEIQYADQNALPSNQSVVDVYRPPLTPWPRFTLDNFTVLLKMSQKKNKFHLIVAFLFPIKAIENQNVV